MCYLLFHLIQNVGLSGDVRKNWGQNECRDMVSSPRHEVVAWNSLPKDVVDLKKFTWVQEENGEMFERLIHGGLVNKTNNITLEKSSELKAVCDSSWGKCHILCPFLSQAPASGHHQRHWPRRALGLNHHGLSCVLQPNLALLIVRLH